MSRSVKTRTESEVRSKMSVQDTKQAAIELIVDQDEDGQVAANVPVRWKISPEMVQRLTEKGVEPYMLLVVSASDRELDRYVLPLKAGMTYLQMRRPGINTIHATIVWQREGESTVKAAVLEKDNYGSYKFDVFGHYTPGVLEITARMDEQLRSRNYNDEALSAEYRELRDQRSTLYGEFNGVYGLIDYYTRIERTPEGDAIDVDVPQEMFAPDPSWLMTKLATLYGQRFWTRSGWRDQCDLRRRATFTAFTLPVAAPIAVLVCGIAVAYWLIVKLFAVMATGVLLFFGKRNLDYSVIYEWDNLDMKDLWYDAKPSFWTYKKVQKEKSYTWGPGTYTDVTYEKRNAFFKYFNPPMIVVYGVAYLIITKLLGGNPSVWTVVSYAVVMPALMGLVALLLAWLSNRRPSAPEPTVVTPEQRTRLERELSSLTNDGFASVGDLPKEKRTIRLHYLHLKATVCKPFAR